nr:sigma-70 family RNA polymerase sigma factor [Lysinibacter cavernae]
MDELFALHRSFALQHAARYATPLVPAEDIVSEAFVKVIQAIRNGKGPTVSMWWYLVSAMKSVAINQTVANSRTAPVEDETLQLMAETAVEIPEDGLAQNAIVEAFNRLPARWQSVIWYRDLAGYSLAETGVALGLNSNGVGALYSRARKAFRVEYLTAIAGDEAKPDCQPFVLRLIERSEAEQGEDALLDEHLETCSSCRFTMRELIRIRSRFAGAMAITAPGLAFEALLRQALAGEVDAMAFGHGRFDVLARFDGTTAAAIARVAPANMLIAAAGGAGAIALAVTLLTSSAPANDTSDTWGNAPTAHERSTAEVVEVPPADPGESAGTDGSEGSGDSSSVVGSTGSAPIVEVAAAEGMCRVFFEPSIGNRMAFFEQRSTTEAECRIELVQPNGDLIELKNGPSTQFAQATRPDTYFIRVQGEAEAPALYSVTLSAEQVTRLP